MEVIRFDQITSLENSGVVSKQHIFPENSNSERVTITEVTMPPGSINPRHSHESSEQIWVALEGCGFLLLGENKKLAFGAGDVARFSEGEIHGFQNTGTVDFVYISVTSPPVNFRSAYEQIWSTVNGV
jgi:quercetin dioxygenase-like cupin family protein